MGERILFEETARGYYCVMRYYVEILTVTRPKDSTVSSTSLLLSPGMIPLDQNLEGE